MVNKKIKSTSFKDALILYLHPLYRLGLRKYSVLFPALVTFASIVLSELYAYEVVNDPNSVGSYIIFINVALIIYFAFRDGIRGGLITTVLVIFYYLYLIYTRNYGGERFIRALETTAVLGILYFLLSAIIGWLKQTIDILIEKETTARYQAEDGELQLQTILQQLPVGVLLVDKATGKMEGNKQMEGILGARTPSALAKEARDGRPFAYRDNKPLPTTDWPIVRALSKGEVVKGEEIEFVRRDKKRLFLRVNAAPVRNKKKEIIAAVSTLYEITREKELEQRKDDFVNMASHELKTPLTSMKLYVEILKKLIEKYKDERVHKTISSIKIQTVRLQELVNDLLDVSRIQTGKLHFRKEVFEINELIEETVQILQDSTQRHKLVFEKKAPIKVFADRFRIYQVLTNLLTNAIKYSPQKTDIIIKVKKEKDKVIVNVKDFGIGINKEQRKKIFERLYQVTDTNEKTFPGLGMGLYISKEIIKRHRGSIWVESEKEKGATFFFSLPIKKPST